MGQVDIKIQLCGGAGRVVDEDPVAGKTDRQLLRFGGEVRKGRRLCFAFSLKGEQYLLIIGKRPHDRSFIRNQDNSNRTRDKRRALQFTLQADNQGGETIGLDGTAMQKIRRVAATHRRHDDPLAPDNGTVTEAAGHRNIPSDFLFPWEIGDFYPLNGVRIVVSCAADCENRQGQQDEEQSRDENTHDVLHCAVEVPGIKGKLLFIVTNFHEMWPEYDKRIE